MSETTGGARPGPREYSKPYAVADRLELLHGPTTGVVELPQHLDWSGRGRYDLDVPGRIGDLYRTVLNEAATADDVYDYLDYATLRRLWATLWLPRVARSAWEGRFPELAALRRLPVAG